MTVARVTDHFSTRIRLVFMMTEMVQEAEFRLLNGGLELNLEYKLVLLLLYWTYFTNGLVCTTKLSHMNPVGSRFHGGFSIAKSLTLTNPQFVIS